MALSQQAKRNHTHSRDTSTEALTEDMANMTDLVEKRRMQNRISQRNYRNKIRTRLENLEAKVGAQSVERAVSETAPAHNRSQKAPEGAPARTPAVSHISVPSSNEAPAFSQSPSMSADGAFSFSASDLSFLNQAQPFGAGPGAPGTPTSQFGSTSTPSLLGEFDDAERRFSAPNGAGVDPKHVSNTIQPMASGPTPFGNSSLSTGMDLDKDANGGAPPGRFAVAPTSHHHNHTSETAPCSHLHVRAPCCGKLVTPYPIYGVPILPVGFMPSQQPQDNNGAAGDATGEATGQAASPVLQLQSQYAPVAGSLAPMVWLPSQGSPTELGARSMPAANMV